MGSGDYRSEHELITSAILGAGFRRATFGGVTRGDCASSWIRVVVRPVEIRGGRYLQFSYFDPKKNTTKNYRPHEAAEPLAEVLSHGFSGIHIATDVEEFDVRTTRKGRMLIGRRKAAGGVAIIEPHNRVKDLPLPEGRADQFLELIGVATADGRVRPTMRAKYTQINEFLKQLSHAIDAADLAGLGRPIEILDCGCGSSYLTLAAHHYLNDVLRIPAKLLGIDINQDVIRKSMKKSEFAAGTGLSFACGKIGSIEASADIVLALHACDTATDDAIAQAVRCEARLLLSVPCCHHAINRELCAEGEAAVLRPLLRHGILRERTADLVTDAFRALALRIMGYKTDVVEFVSTEHTARNLMIRAVRGGTTGDSSYVAEYIAMKHFWGVTPYLEKVLGDRFRELVASP